MFLRPFTVNRKPLKNSMAKLHIRASTEKKPKNRGLATDMISGMNITAVIMNATSMNHNLHTRRRVCFIRLIITVVLI